MFNDDAAAATKDGVFWAFQVVPFELPVAGE